MVLTTAGYAQTGFRDLEVSVLGDPAPGYYFLTSNSIDSIAMMDNAGKSVYRTHVGIHSNVMTYNGKWLTHFLGVKNNTAFLRYGVDLKIIDTLRATPPLRTDFHEGRIVSDSSYLVLGIESLTMDLSKIVPGGKTDANVLVNVIQERTFGGATLFSWRSIDHIPVTDAVEDVDLTVAQVDYIHVNSATYDSDGNILISCRHLDEVIKINRQTGAVIWRFGGSRSKGNQFRFLNDSINDFVGFSHQHTAARTADGTILMYDNGNLKPLPRFSRAVEYELDEKAFTARRVWQFIPTPAIASTSMGSVQELENGNILVGFGTGSSQRVACEVSRDGAVEVVINNATKSGFASYRVHKDVFLMTGVFKRIASPNQIVFAHSDSTTHVVAKITRVDSASSAVIERHSYPPHNASFVGVAPCGLLPMRWIVRFKRPFSLRGSLEFDIDKVPGISYPDLAKLYWRTKEGQGSFALLSTSYSTTTKRLTVDSLLNGEYAIAYDFCVSPSLLLPNNLATEVSLTPTLQWTETFEKGEYQIELSDTVSFATTRDRFSTRSLDTTLPPMANYSNIYWRVRSRGERGFGAWSSVFKFTTRLGVPNIIEPSRLVDTLSILPTKVFRWTVGIGANRYRIRIIQAAGGVVALDTLIDGLSFVPGKVLAPNSEYTWTCTPVRDTIFGRSSLPALFATALREPQLLLPIPDAWDISNESATFTWSPVQGALSYVVTIHRVADSGIVHRDTTSQSFSVVNALPLATRLFWTCRAVGKYGPSGESRRREFITRSNIILDQPLTLNPKLTGSVDTSNVEFKWTAVPGAQYYDLQIASTTNFEQPDLEKRELEGTTCVLPSLPAGKAQQWRVIAYTNTSTSRWSDSAHFTTIASNGQALTPVIPMSGSVGAPVSGLFLYTTSNRYTSYRVAVDTNPDLLNPEFVFSSNGGTNLYTGLRAGTKYYWRAVGRTSSGTEDRGSTAVFTTSDVTAVGLSEVSTPLSLYVSGSFLVIHGQTGNVVVRSGMIHNIQGKLLDKFTWPEGMDRYPACNNTYRGQFLVTLLLSNGQTVSQLVFCY